MHWHLRYIEILRMLIKPALMLRFKRKITKTVCSCTFVLSVDDGFVCVVLEAAIAINEVQHVLCHGEGGHIDRQTLKQDVDKFICAKMVTPTHQIVVLRHLLVWPPRRPC